MFLIQRKKKVKKVFKKMKCVSRKKKNKKQKKLTRRWRRREILPPIPSRSSYYKQHALELTRSSSFENPATGKNDNYFPNVIATILTHQSKVLATFYHPCIRARQHYWRISISIPKSTSKTSAWKDIRNVMTHES